MDTPLGKIATNGTGGTVGSTHGFSFGFWPGILIGMIDREVYPNAPVVMVMLEVRHPAAEALTPAQRSGFKRELVDELPIMKSATTFSGTIGPGQPPNIVTEEVPRFFDRPHSLSVTLRREATVIESTRYRHFEIFRDLALRVVAARHRISPIDGIERVGLRYIDELRPPQEDNYPVDWSPWVHPSLVGVGPHARDLGLQTVESQTVSLMLSDDSHRILLRYGPQVGYAVDPAGELNRATPPPGPYFLLDIDSFWQAQGSIPAIDDVPLQELCDQLHRPVRSLFESLITEKMREGVLRNG